MRLVFFFVSVLGACTVQAQSQAPLSTPQVVISGSQTDVEASREFIAGKIVIGKKRIEESGLQNTGDLLRREPAISIGKDGRIGLLGLAGYTQILVDGSPPQGVNVFDMDLIHIERIEIIKSTTAATGPMGIAGTINIIRRKTERKAYSQIRAGGNLMGGRHGADVSWSSNGAMSSIPVSYSLTFSASRKPTSERSDYVETRQAPDASRELEYVGTQSALNQITSLIAGSDFTWTLSSEHKIKFSPDGGHFDSPQNNVEQRFWETGQRFSAQDRIENTMSIYSLPVSWNWQVDSNTSLAVKINSNRYRLKNNSSRDENWSDTDSHLRENGETREATNNSINLDFNTEVNAHQISAGAKVVRNTTARSYANLVDGDPDFSLNILGNRNEIDTHTEQLYLQDEWRIDRTLAMNIGTSFERRRYQINEARLHNRASFDMWSPSLHLSKKINGDRKRQLRFSLAQSFQPPRPEQMLVRPVINLFAPCLPDAHCKSNTIDSADSGGNPDLKPEHAVGLNASYTRGFAANSELVLELYTRNIRDKIVKDLVFEDVAWADTKRYLYRPANLGTAKVAGINVEGRLAARDISKSLADMELHGSIGVARSEVSSIPGSDNRIVEQTPWRAKLGGSYTAQSLPIKVGFEANLLPADWVRTNLNQRVYQSSQLSIGLNFSWKLNSTSKIIAGAENILRRKNVRVDEFYSDSNLLTLSTNRRSYSRISLRLETSL